jgi:hypothetical protein
MIMKPLQPTKDEAPATNQPTKAHLQENEAFATNQLTKAHLQENEAFATNQLTKDEALPTNQPNKLTTTPVNVMLILKTK